MYTTHRTVGLVIRRREGDRAGWARQLEEVSGGEQAGCVANRSVEHAVE